jgi:hypothetical protein
MADADENQQGRVDLPGLCEFSWSSLKHVEVMAWGSFTFCKNTVFSKNNFSAAFNYVKQLQSLRLTKNQCIIKVLECFSALDKALEIVILGIAGRLLLS